MTDYYPLLSRAVTSLERNTGENRRALYERARTALLAQLRSADPPLSESEITRERLTLEEAVRKVEADAVRKLRGDAPPAGASPAAEAAPSFDTAGQNTASARRGDARPKPANAASPPPNADPTQAAGGPRRERDGARPPRARPPEPSAASPSASPAAPERASEERSPAGSDAGRDLRELLADAERPAAPGRGAPPPPPPARNGAGSAESRVAPPAPGGPPPARPQEAPAPTAAPENGRAPSVAPPTAPERTEPITPRPPRPLPRRPAYELDQPTNPARRGLIAALLSVLVIASLAGAAYWQRDRVSELFGVVRGGTQQAQRDTTQARPKIADRVGQPADTAPSAAPKPGATTGARPSGPVPAVAQRVVLYEEDPANPEGNRYVGSALWRTETVSPGPGLSPELAIRADVELPERKMAMTLSIRRNTDQALPASHTVEIMFNLPADFTFGGVANVPGLLMKESEQSRGAPLSGLAVKVTNGFFLVGLSSAEADLQRNLQLLKERSWFDIPIVYNNGRRAILAVEKGNPGERAFDEAFAAWGNK